MGSADGEIEVMLHRRVLQDTPVDGPGDKYVAVAVVGLMLKLAWPSQPMHVPRLLGEGKGGGIPDIALTRQMTPEGSADIISID